MTDVSQGAMKRVQERLDDHGNRLRTLELNEAGADQWRKATTEKLDGIIAGGKWLMRLALGALILAAINFVISGGLNVTP